MKKPIERTIAAYEALALTYADTWFDDPVMEPNLRRFLSFLERPSCVLDVGCGPGRDVHFMVADGHEAIGLDLCTSMLREAARRVPGAIFRCLDLRFPPYPPGTFDGIWACAALQHLPFEDLLSTLRRYEALLAPGGALAVSLPEGSGDQFEDRKSVV